MALWFNRVDAVIEIRSLKSNDIESRGLNCNVAEFQWRWNLISVIWQNIRSDVNHLGASRPTKMLPRCWQKYVDADTLLKLRPRLAQTDASSFANWRLRRSRKRWIKCNLPVYRYFYYRYQVMGRWSLKRYQVMGVGIRFVSHVVAEEKRLTLCRLN